MEVLFLLCLCFIFDHQVAACPQGCHCGKRGISPFKDDVLCINRNLSTFPLLKTIPKNVENLYLNFTNNQITDITLRDEDVIYLPRTIVFDLSYNLLTRIPAYKKSILSGFTRLLNLDLSYNRIHYIEEDAFTGLHGLLTLHLSNNRLTKVVASWFDSLFDLIYLGLTNNLISSFEPDHNFRWPDSLRRLYLDNNRITFMPPFPIKNCSKKASLWCSFRTNVTLEGNNIYSGCRRPEHNETILNMTLPCISVYCDTNVFRLCPKYNTNSFFQTYVEKPVCEKPRIRVNYTNKGVDLFIVTGEPKPKVSVGIKLTPKYQKQEKATNTIEIRYEAENMVGKTGQTIYFDEETICQFHVITDNNDLQSNTFRSKQKFLNEALSISCQRQNKTFSVANENENGSFSRPRESQSYLGHQNMSLPLWSMVTFCFLSFILALIILVFVIDDYIRSDAIINEDE